MNIFSVSAYIMIMVLSSVSIVSAVQESSSSLCFVLHLQHKPELQCPSSIKTQKSLDLDDGTPVVTAAAAATMAAITHSSEDPIATSFFVGFDSFALPFLTQPQKRRVKTFDTMDDNVIAASQKHKGKPWQCALPSPANIVISNMPATMAKPKAKDTMAKCMKGGLIKLDQPKSGSTASNFVIEVFKTSTLGLILFLSFFALAQATQKSSSSRKQKECLRRHHTWNSPKRSYWKNQRKFMVLVFISCCFLPTFTTAHERRDQGKLKSRQLVAQAQQQPDEAKLNLFVGGNNEVTICHIKGRKFADKKIPSSKIERHFRRYPDDLMGPCTDNCNSICTQHPSSMFVKEKCTWCLEEPQPAKSSSKSFKYSPSPSTTKSSKKASTSAPSSASGGPSSTGSLKERFNRDAFMDNIDPETGQEEIGDYKVSYDFTYNRNGFVTIPNNSYIDEVECLPGKARIRFTEEVSSSELPSMFPNLAVLIINGELFGTGCTFYSEATEPSFIDDDDDNSIGLLLIRSSQLGDSEFDVIVHGEASTTDLLFDSQRLIYDEVEPITSDSSSRALATSKTFDIAYKYPNEGKAQISLKGEVKATTSISEVVIVSSLYSEDDNKEELFLPVLTYSATISEKIQGNLSLGLGVGLLSKKWEIDDFHIRLYGLKVPTKGPKTEILRKILRLNDNQELPSKIGVFLSFPIHVELSAEGNLGGKIEWTAQYEHGTIVEIRGEGNPLNPHSWLPSAEVIERSDPSGEISEPTFQEEISDGASASVSVKLALEAEPQIALYIPFLCSTAIGTTLGIALEAKSDLSLPLKPKPPIKDAIKCDQCHWVDVDSSMYWKDLFLEFWVFDWILDEKKRQTLLFFSFMISRDLFCFGDEPDITCGDKCCSENQECKEISLLEKVCVGASPSASPSDFPSASPSDFPSASPSESTIPPALLDGSSGDFGNSVAMYGDTVVVGAPRDNDDQGSFSIYVKEKQERDGGPPEWEWVRKQHIVPDGARAGDRVGTAVGIHGKTMVIGSSYAANNVGKVYIYNKSGELWVEEDIITSPDITTSCFAPSELCTHCFVAFPYMNMDECCWIGPKTSACSWRFGASVDVYDGRILVGAPLFMVNDELRGAAYTFVKSGGVWVVEDTIAPPDTGKLFFGNSVALNEDLAVVGAPADNDLRGSAYVFTLHIPTDEPTGTPSTEPTGTPSTEPTGTPSMNPSVHPSESPTQAPVIHPQQSRRLLRPPRFLNTGNWPYRAKLTSQMPSAGARFGYSVSVLGNRIVIGEPLANSAHVFKPSEETGTSWERLAELVHDESDINDWFGGGVRMVDRKTILVGAPSTTNRGYVVVYSILENGDWTETKSLVPENSSPGDRFGLRISSFNNGAVIGAYNTNSAHIVVIR